MGRGGANYQMQIEMFDFWGGGVIKLPNENIQKLPTRNVWFWREGG